ncbi:MAG: MBL fold metallo-hydrolase [Candidatus Thermoplasmatota archaeon]|jgi:phosphoribosyl 1,2-cyclic phosphodiesterase|nr:MBL fold metallo-hydrolase [Candidatus Thermoplasmatota archaeon]
MDSIFFRMISSGSKGNCTVIWDSSSLIILDFGISVKRFSSFMDGIDVKFDETALFISHEHSDHCKGAKSLLNKRNIDLYSRKGTLEAMGIESGYRIRNELAIGNFHVTAVDVSHDASEPVAYVVRSGGRKISVVSDLGQVSEELLKQSRDSDILAFEANHDLEMLKTGSYPFPLKRRIMSDSGHLSNEQSAEAISKMAKIDSDIILTHISQENNRPEIALNTVRNYLENRSIGYGSIQCAYQDTGTPVMSIQRL